MAPLYQDPITKLCIRFDQLILDERPVTQGPWEWKFASETLEPYVRPDTPMPARAVEPVVPTSEIPRVDLSRAPQLLMTAKDAEKMLSQLLQDPLKGGMIAKALRRGRKKQAKRDKQGKQG